MGIASYYYFYSANIQNEPNIYIHKPYQLASKG